MQLQLETTNVCQADCVFCPYAVMHRPKGTMPWDLFTKIIDEATTIPLLDALTLTGLGEPLLDRYLVERIAYIRARMARISITLVTNGTLLTEALIDRLIAAGLSTLSISLNAITAVKRQAIMRLPTEDFDRVVAMCRYAIAAGQGRMQTIVKGVLSPDLMEASDHQAFLQEWGSVDNGGHGFVHLEGNWAGAIRPMRIVPTSACGRALQQIMVLWDGRVSSCCFDSEGAQTFGDLHTRTLREIYNEGPHVAFRRDHSEGRRANHALCANCTAI